MFVFQQENFPLLMYTCKDEEIIKREPNFPLWVFSPLSLISSKVPSTPPPPSSQQQFADDNASTRGQKQSSVVPLSQLPTLDDKKGRLIRTGKGVVSGNCIGPTLYK